MKGIMKVFAVLLSLLIMISSSITGNAITVEKDGEEYFLRSRTPATGDCKVLMIRLGFADYALDDEYEPADSEETLLSYFDGSKGSINEFYETSSYGKLRLSCDKVYSYTAEYNRDDYDDNNDSARSDVNSLIQETLNALEDEINYDEYDSDGDGYLDYLCFDFSGPLNGWAETWWPKVKKADAINAGDKKVDLYSLLRGDINIFIHEFGHIIGAADYYSADAQNQYDAIMTYDIMCKNEGDHNGFTKWSYGWLDDSNITFVDKASGDTTVELIPIESKADGKKIAVVAPELNGSFLDEYFLVEYDSGTGNNSEIFEKHKLTPGFRIFHVSAGSNFEEEDDVINYDKTNNLLRDNLIHNVKNEYGNPDSWYETKENMLYREGDTLSFDTNPNTGLSFQGVYNGLFTGISFTDFVTGEKPSFKVSFTDDYSSAEEPELTLSYDRLTSNMKMKIESDMPLAVASYDNLEEFKKHEAYLLDKDGNKLQVSITVLDNSPFTFESSYMADFPAIQPNSEYTFVIPEGFFLTGYSNPVAEFRRTVKTDDFMALNTISKVTPKMDMISSNIVAVTDKTYGIISVPYTNSGTGTFTEYNLNGEELSSLNFKAPDFGTGEDTIFFKCNAYRLNDGNFALAMSSYENYYFVKLDRNGKQISDVFSFNEELVSDYTYSFSTEDLDLYKGGLCKLIVNDDSETAAFLKIDFENGVTVEPTDANYYYYSLDSETYAIVNYYDNANHLLVYDKFDKQIGDIALDASFLCAFEEDGNIKVVYDVFKWNEDQDDGTSTQYVDTYTKDGRLIESKDITEKAKHINEYGVFIRCYPNDNGYFFICYDPDGEKVVAFDKDWSYIDELTFNPNARPSFVGSCGLVKSGWYSGSEYIARFNIGGVEIVPKSEKVNISKAKISGIKNKTYTGKALKQSLTLTCNGKRLTEGTDYTVSYSNNKKAGTASVIIKGKGGYYGSVKNTFKITKAVNTLKVSVKNKTVKASKLKAKQKTVTAITVKKAKGKVSFKKVGGSKYLTINKKGKITVRKGKYKKQTLGLKVKVTAKGNSNYKSGSKTVTVKIKIK